MSARGERTREHLIDVAEQLFGERGIANVSLREIRIAAGQRNAGAMQYHFGDRAGVLQAVLGRHLPPLNDREAEMLVIAEANDDGSDDAMRRYVEVIVRPFAEYGERGASARAWQKIGTELTAGPRVAIADVQAHASPAVYVAGAKIYERLVEHLPPDLALERILTVAQSGMHACADRARIIDDPQERRTFTAHDRFVANLLDMTWGALFAPSHLVAALVEPASPARPAKRRARAAGRPRRQPSHD